MAHLAFQWLGQQAGNSVQPFFTLLVIFFFLFLFISRKNNLKASKLNFPPSPWKLPLIGNLHQLLVSSTPHLTLYSLSQKHGPLMLLHYGQVPTLVVSTASAAQEVLKTHDFVFSSRPPSPILQRLTYDYKDMAFAPYGEYWRNVRKICVLQLLSLKRVQSFQSVRDEELALILEKIERLSCSSSSMVNLSEILVMLTNNIMGRITLGKKDSGNDSDSVQELKEMLKELAYLLGVLDIGSLIPSLSWVNYLTGLNSRVGKFFREMDKFFDVVVEEHIEKRRMRKIECDSTGATENNEDLVDILLEIQGDNNYDVQLGKDHVKALIVDMFVAGTDTTYTAMEWAMAELSRHPKVMKEVQEEVRRISKGKSLVTEDEIGKMHYLKSVIKETLRMHPPLPLLVPRETTENVKIQGYDIQAKTTLFVNAWAIGRDPSMWERPEEFRPSRFMESASVASVDFRGKDFHYIPFGSGRRGCPGITFAVVTLEVALSNLLKRFDWKMPTNIKDLNLSESPGVRSRMKENLVLFASKPEQDCY